jgi:hypothetical protein
VFDCNTENRRGLGFKAQSLVQKISELGLFILKTLHMSHMKHM